MKLKNLRSINLQRAHLKKKRDELVVNLYKYALAFISSSETILEDREFFLREIKSSSFLSFYFYFTKHYYLNENRDNYLDNFYDILLMIKSIL